MGTTRVTGQTTQIAAAQHRWYCGNSFYIATLSPEHVANKTVARLTSVYTLLYSTLNPPRGGDS